MKRGPEHERRGVDRDGRSGAFVVRRLVPADAASYRALMIGAYRDEKDAFTSTAAEREALPLAWWEARVAVAADTAEQVFGAFDAGRLVGVAGLTFERRTRTRLLIELGGLVVKSGVVDLTDDDRATILGALIWIADKLKSDQGEHARSLWAARGRQAFQDN